MLSLATLYDAARTLSYDEIRAAVVRLTEGLSLDAIRTMARSFGLSTGLTSGAACRRAILARIERRKGAWERGEEIARIAKGV